MKPSETKAYVVELDELEQSLLAEYGPLMGGSALWRALGYRSWAAFAKGARTGRSGIAIFSIPGRKGRFALTRDVARFLGALQKVESDRAGIVRPVSRKKSSAR
jgi:hypothetical protein